MVLLLQWLVFRRDGTVTAAEYAARAAEASATGSAVRCSQLYCSKYGKSDWLVSSGFLAWKAGHAAIWRALLRSLRQ